MKSTSNHPLESSRRDSRGLRWLSIALRSLHLVGVVLAGAALFGGSPFQVTAFALMLITGFCLFGIELWSNRLHWRELAGVFIPLKLLLVAAMILMPNYAAVLFWLLLIASSVISHAPRAFRHRRPFG
jgi:hypothetical protein